MITLSRVNKTYQVSFSLGFTDKHFTGVNVCVILKFWILKDDGDHVCLITRLKNNIAL